jgi:uncharacterized membrane protein (UPF0127 family)/quercetin dioxygenase-like cupin family protein
MSIRLIKIGFLLAILCVSVQDLRAEEYTGQIKAEKVLVTTTAGNGLKHAYLYTDRPEVTAMTVEIPPGAETGWHLHTVPVYAYVLAGQLVVELVDGTNLSFKAGEAIVEVQNLAHNGKNSGSEAVKLAVFYTGEEGRPNVTRLEPFRRLTVGGHVIEVEMAITNAALQQGLMNRATLGAEAGMLFDYQAPLPACMWMKDTLIPLSVAFIDPDGVVVNIEEMQAGTTDSHCAEQEVRFVLEMNRGWFARNGIKAGSRIEGLPE